MEYAIASGKYSLANGISVGMMKSELLERYPDMRIEDAGGNVITGTGEWAWWNHTTYYPRSSRGMDEEWDYGEAEYYYWDSRVDYIKLNIKIKEHRHYKCGDAPIKIFNLSHYQAYTKYPISVFHLLALFCRVLTLESSFPGCS